MQFSNLQTLLILRVYTARYMKYAIPASHLLHSKQCTHTSTLVKMIPNTFALYQHTPHTHSLSHMYTFRVWNSSPVIPYAQTANQAVEPRPSSCVGSAVRFKRLVVRSAYHHRGHTIQFQQPGSLLLVYSRFLNVLFFRPQTSARAHTEIAHRAETQRSWCVYCRRAKCNYSYIHPIYEYMRSVCADVVAMRSCISCTHISLIYIFGESVSPRRRAIWVHIR